MLILTLILESVLWLSLSVLVYTYLGYGLLIYVLARMRPDPEATLQSVPDDQLPGVSFIVAAWNEKDFIRQKVANTLALNYPSEKLEVIFVTDGSDDGTPDLIDRGSGKINISVLHRPERLGKIAAMERGVDRASQPILIFSDANAVLNKDAIRNIVKHYQNPEIGAVAGEKQILMEEDENAAGAGEGIYWKYESWLKKQDYRFYSVVGAAGELFSIRRELYEPVQADTILDDFMLSMNVASNNYRVAYAPDARAMERPSADLESEMSRKIRIAAGGLQSVSRLRNNLNPINNFKLWLQYVSHRVLRWTIAPVMLPVVFFLSFLLFLDDAGFIYKILMLLQILFYIMAGAGYALEKRKIRVKILFVPYYFTMMNVAVYKGFWRIIGGKQSVTWEKAKRAI